MGHYRYGSTSPYEHYTKLAATQREQRKIEERQKSRERQLEVKKFIAEHPVLFDAITVFFFGSFALFVILSLIAA